MPRLPKIGGFAIVSKTHRCRFSYQSCAPPLTSPCLEGRVEDWNFAIVRYFQANVSGRWRHYRRVTSKRSRIVVFHCLMKVQVAP